MSRHAAYLRGGESNLSAWCNAPLWALLVFSCGLSIPGHRLLRVGAVIGLAVLLAHRGNVKNDRLSGLMQFSLVAMATWGGALLYLGAGAGRRIDMEITGWDYSMLFTGAMTVVLLRLASRHLPTPALAFFVSLGFLTSCVATPATWGYNPWKYAFSWPVGVCLLSVAATRGRATQVTIAVCLAAASILADFRSAAVLFALSAAAMSVSIGRLKRGSLLRRSLVLGLAAAALSIGFPAAIRSGAFGLEVQQRLVSQDRSGTPLLLSSRPESAAALRVFSSSPQGIGPGVTMSALEIYTAQQGLDQVHADPDSPSTVRYLFAGGGELHSVLWDLWLGFGPLAFLYASICILVFLKYILWPPGVKPSAYLTFLALCGMWDVFFSPVNSNLPYVMAAVAILLAHMNTKTIRMEDPGSQAIRALLPEGVVDGVAVRAPARSLIVRFDPVPRRPRGDDS
jgi:hypothetical protein